MTPTETPRITIEDVAGEFGFRILWSVKDHWADFTVWAIVSRENDKPLFELKDNCAEDTDDTEKAEIYCTGFIKWDGCAEIDQGQPHWCGAEDFKKHMALLKYLYLRASELMGRGPDGLDSRWNDNPSAP